jgi:hypothetical protein
MTLRLDDGFDTHPKIVKLPRGDRWTWLQVLLYCARYRTGGHVPAAVGEIIRGATPAFLARCEKLTLLEPAEDGFSVHDWQVFNGDTVIHRVAAYLESNPKATANEVHREVGGKREVVLAEVARLRQKTGSPTGSPPGSPTGSPRARARTQPEVLLTTDRLLKAEEQRPAAADQNDEWVANEDPVIRLLSTLRHRDTNTERTLRNFVGKVPEAAFDYVRDELRRTRDTTEHDARFAVSLLKRIETEGTLATPTEPPPSNGEDPDPATWPERYVHTSYRLPDDVLEENLADHGATADEIIGWLEVAHDLRNATGS